MFLVGEEVVYDVLHAEKADETGNHCQWKLLKEGAGECSRWKLIEEGGVIIGLFLRFLRSVDFFGLLGASWKLIGGAGCLWGLWGGGGG